MNKQRALVTGGAGFLGSHLCDGLLGEGYTVVAADNLLTGRLEPVNLLDVLADEVGDVGAFGRLRIVGHADIFACHANRDPTRGGGGCLTVKAPRKPLPAP